MRTTPVVVDKFGGMNYLTGYASSIEDNQLKDAVNVIVDEQGVIRRRKGFDSVQSITGPGNNAHILGKHQASSSLLFIAAPTTGVTLAAPNGAVTWTEASLTSAKAVTQYDSNSYIFSYQTQQIMKVDSFGNRTANWANVQGSFALSHKGRIFVTNLYTGLKDRIRYSQLYTDPTNPNFSGAGAWPAANTLDVSPGDGEPIVAMIEYNDNIIIFKRTSTWILYTDGSPLTSWKLQKLNDNLGCVGVYTPVVIGSLLYFMSANGVYRTDGTTFEEISRPIANVWRNFTHNNDTFLYTRSAVEWDGLYIINPEWSDEEWYIFNTRNDTWTRWHTPVNFSRMIPNDDQPLRPLRMMKYGVTSAELWETNDLSGYQDGEGSPSPYDSEIVFKTFDFGQPDTWKYVPQVELAFVRDVATGGEVTCLVQVEYVIDALNGAAIPAQLNLTIDINDFYFLYRLKGPGRFRYLSTRVYTSALSDMALEKLIFHMIQMKGAVGYAHGS